MDWILIIGGAAIAGLLLLGCMIMLAFENRLCSHKVFSPHLKRDETLDIFFISDIHRRTVSRRLLRKCVGGLDAVVIGGDLTEEGVPLEKTRLNVQRLSSLGAPVFFVWGNNDYEVDQKAFVQMLTDEGVQLLRNGHSFLREHVCIIGVDDATSALDDLPKAMPKDDQSGFFLLVSHNPNVRYTETEKERLSGVLTAHTHGGQIRIGPFGPYTLGELKVKEAFFELSTNGYGTSLLPLRLGARSEAHWLSISGE
ncbi:phosphoesterase [Bacillaceae bacterium SIJ1]|uniref:metallophosphoesterase n=1 Tax=Litoribacterium kuwaitense TaxID=1398745 RepID=UPI0013EB9F9F|nr:metallophosphoesterase [Litoribacterium kuwaitense]NGP43681.1 phosphoesterase [Litoribacterium kuwaitense]